MSADDLGDDPVFAAIASLRRRDVSADGADRLRNRCHRVLEERLRQRSRPRMSLRRIVIPALASVWCAVYLCEILRRAATVYGLWVR